MTKIYLPSVDKVLFNVPSLIETYGHQLVADEVRTVISTLRHQLLECKIKPVSLKYICEKVNSSLVERSSSTLIPVLNLTGTVLHTNLGRASLSRNAIDAVIQIASSPSSLEYNLDKGCRGQRDSHIESIICELTGAEAATFVNNNAAAVLLVLNTLAFDCKVPISRGELVEIGGSFRIPDIMASAGCKLVEIGTTNRTHLKDYEKVMKDETALLMKVHTSNFEIAGFTSAVNEKSLSLLAKSYNLPFVVDLGSGTLVNFEKFGLPHERTVQETLECGADIVTFSGDKLLGGPQAGLIAGKYDLIEKIRQNPLKRAMRLDKMTSAALVETLKLYRKPSSLVNTLPTLRLLTRKRDEIILQATRLLEPFQKAMSGYCYVEVVTMQSQVGSGSLPNRLLESAGIKLTPESENTTVERLSTLMRKLSVPIIGRISKNSIWLDFLTLDKEVSLLESMKELRVSLKQ